jgi:hypothetical protein
VSACHWPDAPGAGTVVTIVVDDRSVDAGLAGHERFVQLKSDATLTKKGPARGRGSHLSARGVALARAVGAELGPIARVLTSTSPRAIETAIAMGLAVDETVELPSGYVPGEVDSMSSGPGRSPM